MTREEAIEKVRQMSLPKETMEILEALAPELAESEDERIRKQLIKLVKNHLVNHERCMAEAWLEKQKEQKPILKFKVGDKIHLIDGTSPNYEDDCITIRAIGTLYYIGEFKEGYVPIEQQDKWELVKEQKPAENNNCPEWMKQYNNEYMLNTVLSNYHLHAEVLKKQEDTEGYKFEKSIEDWLRKVVEPLILKEQKPAEWSEEDKEMLKSIIEDITPVGECPDYPTDEEREYYYSGQDKTNWLKELPKRFNLQPKQEWSEEDENQAIKDIIPILKDVAYQGSFGNPNQETMLEFVRRILKSLRPSWKPSEEQMDALKEASASWMNEKLGNAELLKSLYNDLKKLM